MSEAKRLGAKAGAAASWGRLGPVGANCEPAESHLPAANGAKEKRYEVQGDTGTRHTHPRTRHRAYCSTLQLTVSDRSGQHEVLLLLIIIIIIQLPAISKPVQHPEKKKIMAKRFSCLWLATSYLLSSLPPSPSASP